MVRKLGMPVVRHLFEYLRAYKSFSHNVRAYLLSAFVQTVGASMVGTVFALYLKSAGLRESALGGIEGSMQLATAAIALIGAPLVAMLGYRRLMMVALGVLIVSRFAQAFTPTAYGLVVLGAAVGLGDGFLRTINSAYLAEHSTQDKRSAVYSTEFLVRMAAIFIGAIVGGFIPSLVGGEAIEGYRLTITVGAVVMGLGLLLMVPLHEDFHGIPQYWRVSLKEATTFDAWPHLLRVVTPQAFLAAGMGLTAPFVPLYLKETLGASVGQIGIIQGVCSLVVGLAAFGTPVLARRLGVERGITLLQALAIPALLAVPFVGTLLAGVALLVTRSTTTGMSGPLFNEYAMHDVSPRDKPLLAGGTTFVLSVMSFLGNIAGGRLMETSYTAPYVPAAMMWAIGTMLTWTMLVRAPRTHAATEATMAENATEHAGAQQPEMEPAFAA